MGYRDFSLTKCTSFFFTGNRYQMHWINAPFWVNTGHKELREVEGGQLVQAQLVCFQYPYHYDCAYTAWPVPLMYYKESYHIWNKSKHHDLQSNRTEAESPLIVSSLSPCPAVSFSLLTLQYGNISSNLAWSVSKVSNTVSISISLYFSFAKFLPAACSSFSFLKKEERKKLN